MPAAGTVKDKATGRFVKAEAKASAALDGETQVVKDERDLEIEALKAEIEGLKGPEVETPLDAQIKYVGEDRADDGSTETVVREPLRLQSKFTGHTISFKPTIRKVHADLGIVEPVIGIFVQFTGPQRLFDSLVEQEKWDWSDDVLDMVERKLIEKVEFMRDYFPAPTTKIPKHLQQFVKKGSVPEKQKFCTAFGYRDGSLIQCPTLANAGSDFCQEHDPNVTRIVKGGGTTVG